MSSSGDVNDERQTALEQLPDEKMIWRLRRTVWLAEGMVLLAVVAVGIALLVARQARTEVAVARERLTAIPPTLTQVADAAYRSQMAGQATALWQQEDENAALAFGFEVISVEEPSTEAKSIFYDIARQSRNRHTLRGLSEAWHSVRMVGCWPLRITTVSSCGMWPLVKS